MYAELVSQGGSVHVRSQSNLRGNAYTKPPEQCRILNRGTQRLWNILGKNINFIFTQKALPRFLTLPAQPDTVAGGEPTSEQSEVETCLSRTKLLRRAIERCFQPTPLPSQRATLGAAHSLDPFQFITHSPTCIILPATHFLPVSGGKFIGWGILTPFTF